MCTNCTTGPQTTGEPQINLDGELVDLVNNFAYCGGVVSIEGGAERV